MAQQFDVSAPDVAIINMAIERKFGALRHFNRRRRSITNMPATMDLRDVCQTHCNRGGTLPRFVKASDFNDAQLETVGRQRQRDPSKRKDNGRSQSFLLYFQGVCMKWRQLCGSNGVDVREARLSIRLKLKRLAVRGIWKEWRRYRRNAIDEWTHPIAGKRLKTLWRSLAHINIHSDQREDHSAVVRPCKKNTFQGSCWDAWVDSSPVSIQQLEKTIDEQYERHVAPDHPNAKGQKGPMAVGRHFLKSMDRDIMVDDTWWVNSSSARRRVMRRHLDIVRQQIPGQMIW